MPNYYLNNNAQPSGEHEVHKSGCCYMPAEHNKIRLGQHVSCTAAIAMAKRLKQNWEIDGCAYCVPNCHTR